MSGTKKSAPAAVPRARAAARSAAATPLVAPGIPPVVFLDASILIPEYLRSVFLELSEAGMLQANWSGGVLTEIRRNLIDPEGRLGLDAVRVDRMLKLMRSHFPQALVHGCERLVPQFAGRTDPKDEHVAAGALKRSKAVYGGEPVVLGPPMWPTCRSQPLQAPRFVSPAPGRFLAELVAADPGVAVVIDRMLKRFRKPRTTRVDLLNIMANADCGEFADALAAAWGLQPE